jgi:hypothetical protein
VAIQELRTVIRVPEDYSLVGDPTDFSLTNVLMWGGPFQAPRTLADTDTLEAWIRDPAGGSSSPTISTPGLQAYRYDNLGGAEVVEVVWWRRWWMAALFSGTIAVVGILLWRTSWESKIGIVLVVILVATIMALRDPNTIQHALAASAYGILFVVALWLVQGGGAIIRSLRPALAGNGGTPPATQPAAPHPEAPRTGV